MSNALLARAWRFRSYAKSGGWSMGEYFAYPLMMFLATPIFLNSLGTVQYGQWMLLLTFTGVGGLAGLGMGTAATKEVSAHRGRGDMFGALQSVRACLSVTLVSSVGLSLLLLVTGLLIGPDLLARMGDPQRVRTIILFAAAMIALEQIDTVFVGALRGMERFDLSAAVEVLSKCAVVVVSASTAWMTGDLVPVLWANLILTIVRCAIKAWTASKLLLGVIAPSFDRHYAAEAFAFGKWTWAQSLGAAFFATADRFMVGAILGADALARYSICLQLAQQIQTVPAAGGQFLFPAVSRKIEAKEHFRDLAIWCSILVGATGLALCLLVTFFAYPILSLWVGQDIAAASSTTLTALAVAYAILSFNVGPHFILLGSGRARPVAIVNIAAGLIAVSVAFWALKEWGLIGATLGRFIYAIATLTIIPILFLSLQESKMSTPRNNKALKDLV